MSEAPRYRAFLSYSRRDTRIAERVLKQLDSFQVHKSQVGTIGSLGPVPARLRDIFFDRDEFEPGKPLSDQTVAALDASATLIVLCSPDAASSHYVNLEVALFRERHPDRPVIPLIVACPKGTEAKDCFPPALLDQADNPLAADLRRDAEGYHRAMGKVIARVLGVPSTLGIERARRTLRRQWQMWVGAMALVAVLAVGAGYWW